MLKYIHLCSQNIKIYVSDKTHLNFELLIMDSDWWN
jgi:hypothetical protein